MGAQITETPDSPFRGKDRGLEGDPIPIGTTTPSRMRGQRALGQELPSSKYRAISIGVTPAIFRLQPFFSIS